MNNTSGDLKISLGSFLKCLDNRSRAMFWYLWIKGHAGLAELRAVADLENDMDALMHIRKVLNPRAQEYLGRPALVFHRLRLNRETGEQVLFNWWLGIDALSAGERKEPIVDLFEDTGTFTVVAEAPGIEACRAEIGYKNGILTVRLPKIQQNEQPTAENAAGSGALQERPGQAGSKAQYRPEETRRSRGEQPEALASFIARTLAGEDGIITEGRESGKREGPPADIFDEGEYLVVILDLPGAEDGSIQVELSGNGLRVLLHSHGRDLQHRVDLPCPVRQVRRQRYSNGILEIELEKCEV